MIAIDLFCGLGGWTRGLLAEGWSCIGFDIEEHVYGEDRYPAQLVIQDVLTLHGSQFRNVDLIVASPPCQEYSHMAMPFTRGRQRAEEYRTGVRDVRDLTRLFDACFRIQREACEASGRHIPLIVENVRGAQKWVGRSRWNFGSFHLWGDVPALMPFPERIGTKSDPRHRPGQAFGAAPSGTSWFGPYAQRAPNPSHAGSGTKRRTEWSARIAMIPLPLARHIGRVFKPTTEGVS